MKLQDLLGQTERNKFNTLVKDLKRLYNYHKAVVSNPDILLMEEDDASPPDAMDSVCKRHTEKMDRITAALLCLNDLPGADVSKFISLARGAAAPALKTDSDYTNTDERSEARGAAVGQEALKVGQSQVAAATLPVPTLSELFEAPGSPADLVIRQMGAVYVQMPEDWANWERNKAWRVPKLCHDLVSAGPGDVVIVTNENRVREGGPAFNIADTVPVAEMRFAVCPGCNSHVSFKSDVGVIQVAGALTMAGYKSTNDMSDQAARRLLHIFKCSGCGLGFAVWDGSLYTPF